MLEPPRTLQKHLLLVLHIVCLALPRAAMYVLYAVTSQLKTPKAET